VPLVVALMALRMDPDERAEGPRLVGLIIGFAGVVVLLGLDVAGRPGELLGALAILLAAVGYAAGPMIIKHRFRDLDPLGPVTASMGISLLVLTPPAIGSAPGAMPSGETILSVLVLGLACSALAFLLFFALISEVGPGRATVITYVNPVVAVALGVTLLGESLGPTAVAGLLLILAGSWLSTGGRMPPGVTRRLSWARRREPAADAGAAPCAPRPERGPRRRRGGAASMDRMRLTRREALAGAGAALVALRSGAAAAMPPEASRRRRWAAASTSRRRACGSPARRRTTGCCARSHGRRR
jgi:uncharacterized membrane protein